MTVFHIFKSDCSQSSRITLQSSWDDNSCWVHLINKTKNTNSEPNKKNNQVNLSFLGLAKIIFKAETNHRFVFHCQSALILLIFSKCVAIIFRKKTRFVYDIHDLNELSENFNCKSFLRYSYFRYLIMFFLEYFVINFMDIKIMTVSDGLANIIKNKYGSNKPLVVMSAIDSKNENIKLKHSVKNQNVLIFFGTHARLPFKIYDSLDTNGIELHLYGKFDKELLNKSDSTIFNNRNIKYFGEYNPLNISFLENYNYLILFSPDKISDNYKYSLPNKIFQSIRYGLSVIVSRNFIEIQEKLSAVSGAHEVIDNPEEINEIIFKLNKKRTSHFFNEIENLSSYFHDISKDRYRELLQ